jgi:hypothetical protein
VAQQARHDGRIDRELELGFGGHCGAGLPGWLRAG